MVPNIYATIGYSSNVLESFLAFSGNAGKGVFTGKEIEAIKLAVSEVNGCEYCQSAHTALAKMNGFTDDEAIQIRKGIIANERLNALVTLAQEVAKNAGRASAEAKQKFFDQGFDAKALIELVAVITAGTLTNYTFGLTQIEIDFPIAEPLVEEVAVV